jgi:hypothetical protein
MTFVVEDVNPRGVIEEVELARDRSIIAPQRLVPKS